MCGKKREKKWKKKKNEIRWRKWKDWLKHENEARHFGGGDSRAGR